MCRFVTSVAMLGNFGGLDGGDTICQTLAAAANLDGRYLAWLATPAGWPSNRFHHSTGPYMRTDGVMIASNWTELTSGALQAPLSHNELGTTNPESDTNVWTGTSSDGDFTPTTCNAWSTANGTAVATLGRTGESGEGWTDDTLEPCLGSFPISCFEQPPLP